MSKKKHRIQSTGDNPPIKSVPVTPIWEPAWSKHPAFHWSAIVALLVGSFLIYAPSLKYEFVWDDEALVVQNAPIQDVSNTADLFHHELGYGGDFKTEAYRPVQALSFMIDYKFWGLNASGFHLTNIVLHGLSAIALYFLVCLLGAGGLSSLLVSLLFVVHPIGVEVVSYISGRADSLALFMFCFSFIFYILSEKKRILFKISFLVISAVFYSIATLSKEASIILPVIVLGYELWLQRSKMLKVALKMIFFLAAVIFYLFLRSQVIVESTGEALHKTVLTGSQRLMLLPKIITDYFGIIFYPRPGNLHMEYLYGPHLRAMAQETYIFYILFATFLCFLVYRMSKNPDRLVSYGLFWFFVFLFTVLNIVKKINAPIAVHWLYMPLGGLLFGSILSFQWLLSHNIREAKARKNVFYVVIGCYLFYFAAQTFCYSSVWRDNVTLYSYTTGKAPTSLRIASNLGLALQKKGRYEEALNIFQDLLQTNPDNVIVKQNLDALRWEMDHSAVTK